MSDAQRLRPGVPAPLALLIPLATALVLHLVRTYRPFPSVDDFVYVPAAWLANDPSLFPRDDVLRQFLLHTPFWRLSVAAFESSVGLATGFWLLALALAVGTVAAAWRLYRALGAGGWLFPVAALLAFANPVDGVGRGRFEGAFGHAFHVQWLALCFLLWSYDAFVRRHGLRSGLLLGLATLAHPVVGFHGAVVLLVATPFGGRGGWTRLLRTALACAVVSAPVVLPLAAGLAAGGVPGDWTPAELIHKGYLFRAPHEYGFAELDATSYAFLGAIAVAGAAGALLLSRLRPLGGWRAATGLLAGHAFLLVLTVAFHAEWLDGGWRYGSVLPYMLHLSRTSPLFLVLAALLAGAAAEAGASDRLARRGAESVPPRRPTVVVLALLCGVLLGVAALADRRTAFVPTEEAALFDWARTETAPAALFVVPPGMQQFRFYARRGVFVDFKLFSSAAPAALPEWRRRLELVAAPDSALLERRGWPAAAAWDSSYARVNTPPRIAALLRATHADYLVRDLRAGEGLGTTAGDEDTAAVERVFWNRRFEVYRLRRGAQPEESPARSASAARDSSSGGASPSTSRTM